MRFRATDFYEYYQPDKCACRVYLSHTCPDEKADLTDLERLLREVGMKHEQNRLDSLCETSTVVDLHGGAAEDRLAETIQAIQSGADLIYHGLLSTTAVIDGVECHVVGEPDFLIKDSSGEYIIEDAKIAKNITESSHPEIIRQLQVYGWLYEQVIGRLPARIQVHGYSAGAGETIEVTYDGGGSALIDMKEMLAIRLWEDEEYSPVGWSRCGSCGFHDRCWERAETLNDVALVPGVDKGLATKLHEIGVSTIADFLKRFENDLDSLEQLKRPWGSGEQKVGKKAARIIANARALLTGNTLVHQRPEIPDDPNFVMFDLEGLPAHLIDESRIYLWGIQVFGENPGEYLGATSGFGEHGDHEGWLLFLKHAKTVMDEHDGIRFVHWASYEKTHLKLYLERHGDDNAGTAQRVIDSLLDLLPVTQKCFSLPLYSYGLKQVEKWAGYIRTLPGYAGDKAMADYIRANETDDKVLRDELMKTILAYNKEDLEATWCVFSKLRELN